MGESEFKCKVCNGVDSLVLMAFQNPKNDMRTELRSCGGCGLVYASREKFFDNGSVADRHKVVATDCGMSGEIEVEKEDSDG